MSAEHESFHVNRDGAAGQPGARRAASRLSGAGGHTMQTTSVLDRPSPWPARPAVGFLHPLEVVKDDDLDLGTKREILAAWASDASAVEDRPSQRWLLGTLAPVPLSEVLAALRRLDGAAIP